VTKADFKAR